MSRARRPDGASDACPDPDLLLTVGAALGARPLEALTHLHDCEECRGSLEVVATLRGAVQAGCAEAEATGEAERFLMNFDPADVARPAPARARPTPALARVASLAVAAVAGLGASLVLSSRVVDVSPSGALAAAALGVAGLLLSEAFPAADL